MRTLIPQTVEAVAEPSGKRGRVWFRIWGYALTPRALLLLVAGVLFAIPEFFLPGTLRLMAAWDAAVLLLVLLDAVRLPPPSSITVERRFDRALALGEASGVRNSVTQHTASNLRIGLLDALHPALSLTPATHFVHVFPNEAAVVELTVYPARRGDLPLGRVYLRYRSALGLAERWADAALEQTVRVLPSALGNSDNELFLLRARQVSLDKRRVRRIGIGREFETLRDYQSGDELRNLSWTATARRGKPITRTFTTERSQQVWTVLDCGRLSRTTFELPLPGSAAPTGFHEVPNDGRLHLQQLDQAASAAMLLSQVVDRAGDRSGLLAYGRETQQQIAPGKGPLHLRRTLDALALIEAERAEADHRRAAARLRAAQGRRALIFWITEMADSAHMPEVSLAVADLARNHLVCMLLLQPPELTAFAAATPDTASEMFAITAANEMLRRRRTVVAQLERRGILVVETAPATAGIAAINQYLDIRARGNL